MHVISLVINLDKVT